MHPLIVLLNLAAAVMLLLWAVRMVRTGMERAYGSALRDGLRHARGGAAGAAGAGAMLAILLQSATAVGVLAAGFAASGLLGGTMGLAALLGADLGSALVVRILAFDLSALIPALLLIGATLFLKFEARRVRQIGRILLGIGFILLSLTMIGTATEPMRESAVLPAVIRYLEGDPLTGFAVVALLTWGMHSSVAMVLLLAALSQGGVLPLSAAIPMLLGANFGAGLIAVWLTRGMAPAARRIPLGNLILRGTIAALALFVFWQGAPQMPTWLGSRADVQIVNAHVLFNLAVVVLGLPAVGAVHRLSRALLPDAPATTEPERRPRSALDRTTLSTPTLALASAKRELLLMGETVEDMLRPLIEVLDDGSADRIAALRALDDEVDRRHSEVKLFIAELNRGDLSDEDARHSIELTDFAINLEHMGDIIAKTLLPLAQKKAAENRRFSAEGWREIRDLHARVLANTQLAMNVLISGDTASARQLMLEKEAMRRLERESHERHLERLQRGNADSLATSNWHLEVVRALKEINSLLVTVAVPILEERGMMLKSRLAEPR
ncbi:MAG: phosphate:Na+ symporter [Rhodobacteraceae bacterium HLUCCA12]|nr:MAG: phosphate:Na+ symporter [Rhodobacteraceae bacterium HLUCCA12]